MEKIKLGIIEDNVNVVEVVKNYLESTNEFEFTFTLTNPNFLKFNKDKVIETDVVLCDIGLPNISGIEVVLKLKKINPELKILMFTVFEDNETIFKSIKAGANGYLLKNTSLPQLKQGILEIVNGGASMSPQIASKVLTYFRKPKLYNKELEKLTEQEKKITELLYQGDKYKTIATKLSISIDTVKYHIKNIYLKLQISSRAELSNKFH
ncbi:response regulator [Psychroflexus maritimus]|uniref:Response regulator transcription factor n=1 Tax=Psychroflexus maritimus TaxID=2714865 RepID=A0A967AFC3_9FLAO|nr:response regulator transcription factor [Psychroflexus maritimus]NGZ90208.1 response regulator transcription factor [Psychroflexus maritimus]